MGEPDRAARSGRATTVALGAMVVACPLLLAIGSALGQGPWYVSMLGIALLAALYLFVAIFVPIAAHEFGHLMAGRLVGMRPALLIIGPWGWRRRDGVLRFFWSGNILNADGLAGAFHGPGVQAIVWRELIAIAGGPLASVISALPGLRVGFYVGPFWQLYDPHHLPVNPMLVPPAFFAAGGLVCSLLPVRTGPIRTDGSSMMILVRGGTPARRYAAIAQFAGIQAEGGDPNACPKDWIEEATAVPDGSTDDAYGCWYGYRWAIGLRDHALADRLMDRAISAAGRLPHSDRRGFYVAAAFHAAFYWRDAARSRDCWTKALGAVGISPLTLGLTEAAVMLAEGRADECLRRAAPLQRELESAERTLAGEELRALDILRTLTRDAAARSRGE